MNTKALCYLSATEAIKKFASGELSPVTLMQAIIKRAEAVEPVVNAFVHTYFDEALEQAKVAEQRYRDGTARSLEGIPVAIKESSFEAGKPCTMCSLLYKDSIVDKNEPMVQRLLDAGAILHARTAIPEFLFNATTHSLMNGVTRNPWNPEYSSGASSGGSAASVAAGTTILATGSDGGGSTRIPASQNGVIGFKPPYGRVPAAFPHTFDRFYMNGPLARTVADAILMENVMVGQDPTDIESLHPKLVLPTEYAGIEEMRIGYTMDFGYREVDAEIIKNTRQGLDRLRDLGAAVEHIEFDWTAEVETPFMMYAASYIFPRLKEWITDAGHDLDSELISSYVKLAISMDLPVGQHDFLRRGEFEQSMYDFIGPLLTKYDALVAPTVSVASVAADWEPSQPLHINGKETVSAFGQTLALYFNGLGRLPVINVPTGRDSNNVPTGMQIVGQAFHDEVPFQIAKAYETKYRFFAADEFPSL